LVDFTRNFSIWYSLSYHAFLVQICTIQPTLFKIFKKNSTAPQSWALAELALCALGGGLDSNKMHDREKLGFFTFDSQPFLIFLKLRDFVAHFTHSLFPSF
jgi:hypothetical protein